MPQQLKVVRELDARGATLLGFPASARGTDFFVDKTGHDGNDGLGWGSDRAFLTIQAALTAAKTEGPSAAYRRGGVRIFVGGGYYSEALTTPTNAECPFGQLIAYSPSDISHGCVYVDSATSSVDWLTVLARGWRISGFEVEVGSTAAGVKLDNTNGTANYTQIDGCHFTGGKYGIDAIGSASKANYVNIKNNLFSLLQATGAIAIGSTAGINCNVWNIEGNTFVANKNHIVFIAATAPYNATIIRNVLHDTWVPGGSVTSAIDLTTSGASNIITQNFLGGTFSLNGGYRGGSTDNWYANRCSAGIDSVADPA